MSAATKLFLGAAISVAIVAAFGLRFDTTVWSLVAAYWIWKHAQLQQDYEDLRSGRTTRPHEYRLTVRPETFQHFMEIINSQTPPPPSPGHYSVGGTTPHLCICGKPLEDHR